VFHMLDKRRNRHALPDIEDRANFISPANALIGHSDFDSRRRTNHGNNFQTSL
jgi:hypothetical protein